MSTLVTSKIRDLQTGKEFNVSDVVAEEVVLRVPDIKSLLGLEGCEGMQVSVAGYHEGSTEGGGTFVLGAGRHNGGTFIDPTRAFPTNWNDQSQLEAWFADSGVDVVGFTRVCDDVVRVEWFGADSSGSNVTQTTYSIQSAINHSAPLFKSVEGTGTYRINDTITLKTYRTDPAVSLDFTTMNLTLNKVIHEATTGVAVYSESPTASLNIKYLLGSGGSNNTVGLKILGQGNAEHKVGYISGFGKNVQFEGAYSHDITIGYCQDAMTGVEIAGNEITVRSGRIGGRYTDGGIEIDPTTCDIGVHVISGVANKIHGTIEYCKRSPNSICLLDNGEGTVFDGYIESGNGHNIYATGRHGRYNTLIETNRKSKVHLGDGSNEIILKRQKTGSNIPVTGVNSTLTFDRPCEYNSKGLSEIYLKHGYKEYLSKSALSVKNELSVSNKLTDPRWVRSSIGQAAWGAVTTTLVSNAFPDIGYTRATQFTFPASPNEDDIYVIGQDSLQVYDGVVSYGCFLKVNNGTVDILVRTANGAFQSRNVVRLSASDKWVNVRDRYTHTTGDSVNAIFQIQFRCSEEATVTIANAYLINGSVPEIEPVNKTPVKQGCIQGISLAGNTLDNGLNINGVVRKKINDAVIDTASQYLTDFMEHPVVIVDGGWSGNLFLAAAGLDGQEIVIKRTNVASTGVTRIVPGGGVTIDNSTAPIDIAPINLVVKLMYSEKYSTWLRM